MTAKQAMAAAYKLQDNGQNRGPAWAPIIKALGYDPRSFTGSKGNETLTLGQSGGKILNPAAPLPGPAAQSPAAAATPAMPAPTYDSEYWNDLASGQANYDTEVAGINLNRGRVAYDTGIGANGQVDLSNPYNQSMMLQRSWEQGQRGTTGSMAAQGMLYSGAHEGALAEGNFQYERGSSALRTGAQRSYEDLSLQERGAGNTLSENNYGAGARQAGRWTDQQEDWFARYG